MQLKRCTWIVLLVVALHVTSTAVAQFRSDDYFYLDPDMEYEDDWSPSLADDDADANEPPDNFPFSLFPRSAVQEFNDPSFSMEATTECETEAPSGGRGGGSDSGRGGGSDGGKAGMPGGGESTTMSGGESTTMSAPTGNDAKPAGNKTTSSPGGSEEQPVATTCYPLPYPYQHQSTGAPGATTNAPSDSSSTATSASQSDATTAKPSQSDATTAKPSQSESTTSASAHAESTASPSPSASTAAPGGPATGPPTAPPAHAQPMETTTCIPEDTAQTPPPTTTTPRAAVTVAPPPGAAPSAEATTCVPFPGGARAAAPGYGGSLGAQPASAYSADQDGKAKELHQLVQHLYVAQARVQLEAIEIKKAQAVANSAQQQLEEAANHVRTVTAALQTAQQEVASAAIRAQTAQLQLAAHDQLLFAARQDVDALSSQMVGMQAAEGISAPSMKFDINGLLDKLKQPLTEGEKPTPVPPMVAIPSGAKQVNREDDYYDYD